VSDENWVGAALGSLRDALEFFLVAIEAWGAPFTLKAVNMIPRVHGKL
jgi:hypothetical protein